jgi:serine phosphatase RsbU (regulator of sigma subunit)
LRAGTGIVAGTRWRDVDQRFEPGDIPLLIRTGLSKAGNAAGRFFGIDRLVEAARQPARSATEIRENVLEASSTSHGRRWFAPRTT